jgi:hypothetical protein
MIQPTRTHHPLPYHHLSPEQFEELCLLLVQHEGTFDHVERVGGPGDRGYDVIAWEHRGTPQEKCWCFQCKRYKKLTFATLRDELDKMARAFDALNRPDVVVFVTNAEISPKTRGQARNYARDLGFARLDFWDRPVLDAKTWAYPIAREKFFATNGDTGRSAWRRLWVGLVGIAALAIIAFALLVWLGVINVPSRAVVASETALLSSPDNQSDAVSELNRGQRVEVLGKVPETMWLWVETSAGDRGWVRRGDLKNLPKNIPPAAEPATPAPTPPEARKLYYFLILDASSRMAEGFEGSDSKWIAAQESAMDLLTSGLPSKANYGLIALGGNQPGSSQTCDDPNQILVPLGPDQRKTVMEKIESLEPQGVASLTGAIALARDKLLDLPGDLEKTIFVITGGGDSCCPDDEWESLLDLLELSIGSITAQVDLVILADENVDEKVQAAARDIIRLGLENVRAEVPSDEEELINTMDNVASSAVERARVVEPTAIAAEETVVAATATAVAVVPTSAPLPKPTRGISKTPTVPIVSPSSPTSLSPMPTLGGTPQPTSTPKPPPPPTGGTATATHTPTPTPAHTPIVTPTPTHTPTATPTFTPTATSTSTATPTPFPISPPTSAPVEKTGQSTRYADGDDDDLQRGVAWPNPRFTDNGDGTVTDNLTGLIWLKNANCTAIFGQKNWATALSDVKNLAAGYCGLMDGSSAGDWRLPNVKELASLIHYGVDDPALPNTSGTGKWMNEDPFTDVQSDRYWSSTSARSAPRWAFDVDMYHGEVYGSLKSDSLYVWPVRGGGGTYPAPVEKTGQTRCYDTRGEVSCTGIGQDGGYQKGVAWPNPRFTDNANGTVTDNLTGLIWLKNVNSNCFGQRNWATALSDVNNLAAGHCGLTDDSRAGDWRLPSVRELFSLADFSQYGPALPSTSPQWF